MLRGTIGDLIATISAIVKTILTAEVVFSRPQPVFQTVRLPGEHFTPPRVVVFRPETAGLMQCLNTGTGTHRYGNRLEEWWNKD